MPYCSNVTLLKENKTMMVKELIARLNKCKQHAEVLISTSAEDVFGGEHIVSAYGDHIVMILAEEHPIATEEIEPDLEEMLENE
jgi:hypothetical protein